MNTQDTFRQSGIELTDILVPSGNVSLMKWSVIACDQYTQDRSYWQKAAEMVGEAPSTLNVILPEVYLDDGDRDARLASIRKRMKDYLESDVFAKPVNGMIYIERTTGYGRVRKGLVTAVDLEAYDWKPGSKALIRATEATIVERIPPRMDIRRGAPIESPHIMLLVNDPDGLLIEETGRIAKLSSAAPLYETELMLNSGSVAGWDAGTATALDNAARALRTLAERSTEPDGSCFLFAVGDGNHSLATAKAVWDEYKSKHPEAAGTAHPARFALVELVNLYDAGLTFEPIHRVLFNADAPDLCAYLRDALGGSIGEASSAEELERLVSGDIPFTAGTRFGFVWTPEGKSPLYRYLDTSADQLAVSRLQGKLDDFIAARPGVRIDYIHGSDEVFRLGARNDAVSILLPPIRKDSFFTTIAEGGPLPRKSFSMGEASEKRFYLECRRLFG